MDKKQVSKKLEFKDWQWKYGTGFDEKDYLTWRRYWFEMGEYYRYQVREG